MIVHPLANPSPIRFMQGTNGISQQNSPCYERNLLAINSSKQKKANNTETIKTPFPKLMAISWGLSIAGLGGNGGSKVGVRAGVNETSGISVIGAEVAKRIGVDVGVCSAGVAVSVGELLWT
jgi:hypothetical protein